MLAMHPSNRIRELRKRAKLSQTELAELSGVSQPAISQIENDERPLNVDWMRTFAKIFDCAPVDLLGDQDNPDRLSEDERRIVQQYREADELQREMIARVAEPRRGYRPEENGKAA